VKAVRLSDLISDARSGFASGKRDPTGVFQVRMNNVTRGGGWDLANKRYVPLEERSLDRYSLARGDVLFNATNSPELIGKTALVAHLDEPTVFSNHFLRLRTDATRLDPRYLARWLQLQFDRGLFSAISQRWVNQASVPRDRLLTLLVPLPSLDAQQRVARLLDVADQARLKREKSFQLIELLPAVLFREMFGTSEPAEGTWPVAPLSACVGGVEGGRSLAGVDEQDDKARFRVLRVSAVTSNEFRPGESRPAPSAYQPPPAHFVRQGDLLFSRANTSTLVGAVALVNETPENLLLPDKLWRIVWRDPDEATPEFVWQLLQSPYARRAISRRATGTSGSMKNISAEKLLSISVIHPPHALRTEFAAKYRGVQALMAGARAHLDHLDALFASLQHRAFAGEL